MCRRVRVYSFVLYVCGCVLCVRVCIDTCCACVRTWRVVRVEQPPTRLNKPLLFCCLHRMPRSVPRVHSQLGKRHCEEWPLGGVANTAAKLFEENERTHNYRFRPFEVPLPQWPHPPQLGKG
jgi:hypothetical protein